mmetsp:Transcript_37516/g.118305  ORF Transcript_37516/g.118305 Transcript_37516/m.118305 type:complete len:120 (-) Transcript_37516:590-949(-)
MMVIMMVEGRHLYFIFDLFLFFPVLKQKEVKQRTLSMDERKEEKEDLESCTTSLFSSSSPFHPVPPHQSVLVITTEAHNLFHVPHRSDALANKRMASREPQSKKINKTKESSHLSPHEF